MVDNSSAMYNDLIKGGRTRVLNVDLSKFKSYKAKDER